MEKKEKEMVEMTEISVKKLENLMAENEAMRLNMRWQEVQRGDLVKELAETKDTLGEMVKRLGETRDLLHASLELQARYKNVADGCVDALREFIFKLLTRKNQEAMKKVLGYYKEEAQMRLMIGFMNYLLFGKKYKSGSEVERTHFELLCAKIDEDCVTLPAHSLMVKLIVKYGLFQQIKEKLV